MSLPFPFLSLQFAVPEDTPELAAFLYNSTISHYIRRRDVAVAEPHRKNSAKILVSYLKAIYWDCAGKGETTIPQARQLGQVTVFLTIQKMLEQ